jgi:hypothetical protein
MDDLFLCPDCHAEHAEPLDASLGHVVRCLTCELLDGAVVVPIQIEPIREPLHIEIHIAA